MHLSDPHITPIVALIARIHGEGLSILLVEQNVVQSLSIATKGYILEQGECVLSGPASELRNNTELKRAYLGM